MHKRYFLIDYVAEVSQSKTIDVGENVFNGKKKIVL